MRHAISRPRNAAFTLIELLVVISIIALLISILLPVLSSARSAARGAVCLSNQHQLSVLLAIYSTDNGEEWPAVNIPKTSPQWAGTTWAGNQWRWHADFLYPYSAGAGTSANFDAEAFGSIFTCPAVNEYNVDPTLASFQRTQASARGYGMNNRLNITSLGDRKFPGNGNPYKNHAKEFFKSPRYVKSPSDTMVTMDWTWFADLAPSASPTPLPTDNFYRRIDIAGLRHNDAVNISYLDGHSTYITKDAVPPSHNPGHPRYQEYLKFWDGGK